MSSQVPTYFELNTKTRWITKLVTVATPWAIINATVSLVRPCRPMVCSGEYSRQYNTVCTAKVEAYNNATLMAVLPLIFARKVHRALTKYAARVPKTQPMAFAAER